MAAVKVCAQPVKAAQRRRIFQLGGGFYINGCAFLAAKRAAILGGYEDLFMLNMKRLHDNGDKWESDKQEHR